MMNEIFGALLWIRQLIPADIPARNDQERVMLAIRQMMRDMASQSAAVQGAHSEALERCRSAFALLLTSVGVPGHGELWNDVRALIKLRTSHAALQRNEVDHLYFHAEMDCDDGVRAFATAAPAESRWDRRTGLRVRQLRVAQFCELPVSMAVREANAEGGGAAGQRTGAAGGWPGRHDHHVPTAVPDPRAGGVEGGYNPAFERATTRNGEIAFKRSQNNRPAGVFASP